MKWWRDKGKDVYPDSPFPSLDMDDSTLAGLESEDPTKREAGDEEAGEVRREQGGQRRVGWGFDLEWESDPTVASSSSATPPSPTQVPQQSSSSAPKQSAYSSSSAPNTLTELTSEPVPATLPPQRSVPQPQPLTTEPLKLRDDQALYVQRKMEECIDAYMLAETGEDVTESVTQEKKRVREEEMKKRKERSLRRLANKKGGGRGMH